MKSQNLKNWKNKVNSGYFTESTSVFAYFYIRMKHAWKNNF